MKIKLLLAGIPFLCWAYQASGQAKSAYNGLPSLVWPKLMAIEVETTDDLAFKPAFNSEVRALEGKEVYLPGYIIPFQSAYKSDHIILSALPLNACFFCGKGGPETVVEVFLKEPVKYTDRPVEIKGLLKLNASNPEQMIYLLEDAKFLGEVDF